MIYLISAHLAGGATVSSVTIGGTGLSGATVTAPTGITPTVKSTTSTSLVVDLAVAANATAGNNTLTVHSSGSPPQTATTTFFVQVPTSLSIVTGTSSTTGEARCDAASFGTGCGVSRTFTYQVNDQENPPQPIQVGGLQVWDAISTTSPNNLGISGYVTTCTNTPAGTNNGPCNVATNALGQFAEQPGLSVCSTVCRGNNICIAGGPTNANQTVLVGSFSIVQSLSYFCDHIIVNGQ